MHIVLLRFADRRAEAGDHLDGHNAWLARGFEDGVFVLAGGIRPAGGGAVLAHGESLDALRARVAHDPFVARGVVTAEIVEVAPGRTDDRLAFLGPAGGGA